LSDEVDRLAEAVLYEGHLLYPYARSALKNQRRYPLGALYPDPFCRAHDAGDLSSLQMECLALARPGATMEVSLAFLHQSQEEAIPREVRAPRLSLGSGEDSRVSAQFVFAPLCGELVAMARPLRHGVYQVTVRVLNETPFGNADQRDRDDALLHALSSPHLLLHIAGGAFTSLADPPEALCDLVVGCKNVGTWPVLVGDRMANDRLLSSPIILDDYPQIAPESPGDFFDGTEMDEMLTLRILTLADAEKQAMVEAGGKAKALLERTESLGYERMGTLHGRLRNESELRPGSPVRLRPRGRADIFDLALAGKRATVHSVETDLENRTYIGVTVDDDPGKDLGVHGHRFFFRPDEVEPL
jgi:hypothetical protein